MQSNGYTSYFVPGYGISRHVMFTNIHYYLGPYASVRPFSYQQREGYLVSNPGTPLTKVSLRAAPEPMAANACVEPNRRLAIFVRTV